MTRPERLSARALRYGLAMQTVGMLEAFRGLRIIHEIPGCLAELESQLDVAQQNAAAALHDLLACGLAEDEECHD